MTTAPAPAQHPIAKSAPTLIMPRRRKFMGLWFVAAIVLFLNLPFGFWRARVRKFSWQWILAMHLPVPLIIALRFYGGLGWRFITFPVLIGAFFLGQFAGGKVSRLLNH